MSVRGVRVSVPGKVILAGEHSAVYGYPALVSALGLRATVEIQAAGPGEQSSDGESAAVELNLIDLERKSRHDWSSISDLAASSQAAWERFDRGAPFEPVAASAGDAETLVLVALGGARERFGRGQRSGGRDDGFRLTITSEIPLGAGCGSSAAISAGVVAAYASWIGSQAEVAELEQVALDVERRQHGRPSGVDTAAVFRGGLLWVERREDELLVTALEDRGGVGRQLRLYNSGTPEQSTGEVVTVVSQRLAEGAISQDTLVDLGEQTRNMRGLVVADSVERSPELRDVVRALERGLEDLGIVPETVAAIAREVEASGGALKVSGAGSLSGNGGGLVLVYDPAAGTTGTDLPALAKTGWQHLDAELAAPGLYVEVD